MNSLKTIKNKISATYRDRGSKFLGFLFPCAGEQEFNEELQTLKSKYPDATHHCWGYRMNPVHLIEVSNDDGEPAGTAGLPILNQLKSFDVVNAAIVVVRYFGGTKLGKSGLIQAYGFTAEECLKQAKLNAIRHVCLFKVQYAYPLENLMNKLVQDFELMETASEYLADVKKIYACPIMRSADFEAELKTLAHLAVTFTKKEESFVHK